MLELKQWLQGPVCGAFPYEAVLAEYWRVGKHFVDAGTLAALAQVRDRLALAAGTWQERQRLARFLDVALDKHDGRYDYPSYLALALLPLPDPVLHEGRFAQAEDARDLLLSQLLLDLLHFELAALDGEPVPLPRMRADAGLAEKRCRLALKVLRPVLIRQGAGDLLNDAGGEDDEIGQARALCAGLADRPQLAPGAELSRSMLPVYVLHDEYLFLRVLQSFETHFSFLCVGLSSAIQALRAGDGETAIARLSACNHAVEEAAPLFSLLGTMRAEAFREFRVYTEGASAIQSRAYKTMEALCRKPDAERLDSLAFHSVPEVRARVLAGQATLEDALFAACADGSLDADGQARLREQMNTFETGIRHWRKTHHSLAVKMLGDAGGTGYTEGTPYLKAVMHIPVFTSGTADRADTGDPPP
jgi:tryptophan 2,3-dioxygenase